jgi:GT2 family glycosyltransferase
MHEPKVAIILLNWNGERDTIECLESLTQITYSNYEIIVVDNNSARLSIETIKDYADGKIDVKSPFFDYAAINKPMQVAEYTFHELRVASGVKTTNIGLPSTRKLTVILNERNLGFAEGNNVGIRYALKYLCPAYILLLNNDTVVHPDFLSLLVETAQSEERIGAVGPALYSYEDPHELQSAGGKINMWTGRRTIVRNSTGNVSPSKTHVDYIGGSSFLFNTDIVEEVGLLDPDYFVYVEDVDWCYRIKKKGYSILVNPESKVWHKGSMSTGGGHNASVLFYTVRNNMLFLKKNAKLYHVPTYIAFTLYYFTKTLLKSVIADREGARSMIRGIKASFSKRV